LYTVEESDNGDLYVVADESQETTGGSVNVDGDAGNSSDAQVNVNGSPNYITKNRWIGYCQNDNSFLIKSPDGMQYEMGKKVHHSGSAFYWYTNKIIDRNGNVIAIKYLGDSDPYSVHNKYPLIEKIYEGNTNTTPVVRFLYHDADNDNVRLNKIISGSRTWDYSYLSTDHTNKYFLNESHTTG
jgi:hypothetical protein